MWPSIRGSPSAFAFRCYVLQRLSDAIIAHATANVRLLGDAWLRGRLQWLA